MFSEKEREKSWLALRERRGEGGKERRVSSIVLWGVSQCDPDWRETLWNSQRPSASASRIKGMGHHVWPLGIFKKKKLNKILALQSIPVVETGKIKEFS